MCVQGYVPEQTSATVAEQSGAASVLALDCAHSTAQSAAPCA